MSSSSHFRITGSEPFSQGLPALLARPASPSLKRIQPFAHGFESLLARAPRPFSLGLPALLAGVSFLARVSTPPFLAVNGFAFLARVREIGWLFSHTRAHNQLATPFSHTCVQPSSLSRSRTSVHADPSRTPKALHGAGRFRANLLHFNTWFMPPNTLSSKVA